MAKTRIKTDFFNNGDIDSEASGRKGRNPFLSASLLLVNQYYPRSFRKELDRRIPSHPDVSGLRPLRKSL
jgi:hypothetical protein